MNQNNALQKFSRKKNGELTLSVIVMAALALVVLIIMIAIFAGKVNLFNRDVSSCATKNGDCVKDAKSCSGQIVSFTCEKETDNPNPVCCIQGCGIAGGTCENPIDGDCPGDRKELTYVDCPKIGNVQQKCCE